MRTLYRSYKTLGTQNHLSILRGITRPSSSTAAAAPVQQEKIVIPKRIPRGPTDILYALSATVGRDTTAAHYKYHDDPFLIPMSNVGKRTFAMAQEAGRKAAKWLRQEHSSLFQVIFLLNKVLIKMF